MYEVIVGIDPGLKGGLSILLLTDNGSLVPDSTRSISYGLDEYLRELNEIAITSCNNGVLVAIEQVHSMPKQGVASTFKFGEQFGILKGLCMGIGVKFITITPQEWKRGLGLLHQDKDASIALAKKLFPGANLRPSARCRKDSDGMAESLLIAEYARRKLCGN